MKKTILVTGGAGFIGSAVIRYILDNTDFNVINIDKFLNMSDSDENIILNFSFLLNFISLNDLK